MYPFKCGKILCSVENAEFFAILILDTKSLIQCRIFFDQYLPTLYLQYLLMHWSGKVGGERSFSFRSGRVRGIFSEGLYNLVGSNAEERLVMSPIPSL